MHLKIENILTSENFKKSSKIQIKMIAIFVLSPTQKIKNSI
jgi:hypothetical protein